MIPFEFFMTHENPKISQSQTPEAVNLLGVTYNTNNYGVRVLLSGAVDGLARFKHNIEIRILDYGHDPVTWIEKTQTGDKDLSLINLRFSYKLLLPNNIVYLLGVALLGILIKPKKWREWLWNRNPWLRLILRARANLSLAGGDSFSDIYGFGRLLYVLLPQILVIILGKPLILLPQTFGPFNKALSRILARFVFRHAVLVYSRDLEGVKIVNEVLRHDDSKVRFAPDLGFAMEAEPIDEATISKLTKVKRNGLLVGLNISKLLYMGGYTRDNMFGLRLNYPDLINDLIDFLVREASFKVLLVPHVYGGIESVESEITLYRRLLPKLENKYPGKITFIDKVFSHRQVKSIIGQSDIFIGSRMHACIASVSQAVPTLCLAYSDKFRGVMKTVSGDIGVLDLRDASTQNVIEATRLLIKQRPDIKKELQGKMPDILASIAALFQTENLL